MSRASQTPGETYGDGYGYGYGRTASVGDHLPHPGNWPDPEMFWHGMRAALRGRGLDLSMFLVVIPLDTVTPSG